MKNFITELNQNEIRLVSGGTKEIINAPTLSESEREAFTRIFVDFIVSIIFD